MMETSAPRKLPIGGIVAAIGGGLAILGSILTWATVTSELFGSDPTQTVKGLEGDGKITVVLGAIVLLCGIVMLVSKSPGARRAVAIVAIIGGVLTSLFAVIDLVDVKANAINDIIKQLGGNPDTISADQRKQVEDAFKVSVGLGLYLTIAAGAIGLVGGLAGLRKGPQAEVLAAPPPGATGDDTGFSTPPAAADGTPLPPAEPPEPPSAPLAP